MANSCHTSLTLSKHSPTASIRTLAVLRGGFVWLKPHPDFKRVVFLMTYIYFCIFKIACYFVVIIIIISSWFQLWGTCCHHVLFVYVIFLSKFHDLNTPRSRCYLSSTCLLVHCNFWRQLSITWEEFTTCKGLKCVCMKRYFALKK